MPSTPDLSSIALEAPEERHGGAIALAIVWSAYMQTAATLIAAGVDEEQALDTATDLLGKAQQKFPWESIPGQFPGLARRPSI